MNEYSTVLADLEEKAARLEAEKAEVLTAITAIYEGMTVRDAAMTVLRSRGTAMGAAEIAKVLKAAGYKTEAKQLHKSIYRELKDAITEGRGVAKSGTGFALARGAA